MDAKEKQSRLRYFEGLCRRHGLSMTVQRRTILEALLDKDDHPTADEVYGLVEGRIRGLSRTTVYRVLGTLVRIGVINKVCHPAATARFDPKTRQHHHLVCRDCDKIVDLEDVRLNAIRLPRISAKGFEIREFHIHFRGICPQCRKKTKKVGRRRVSNTRRVGGKQAKHKRASKPTRNRRNEQ